MKKITIQDMKAAVNYVNNGNYVGNVMDIADEDFAACDFGRDLKMGNIRVANVIIELERRNNGLRIPHEILKEAPGNTVADMLEAINKHIDETA